MNVADTVYIHNVDRGFVSLPPIITRTTLAHGVSSVVMVSSIHAR